MLLEGSSGPCRFKPRWSHLLRSKPVLPACSSAWLCMWVITVLRCCSDLESSDEIVRSNAVLGLVSIGSRSLNVVET